MIPEKGDDTSPAMVVGSCAANEDNAMHIAGDGWTNYGVKMEMFWGGENNPACYEDDLVTEDPESIMCWEALFKDDRITLDDIRSLPGCDTDRKVECATRGRRFKSPRDLSMYKGIGFWIVATPENETSFISVLFPIPATTRWESAGAAGGECDSDDDVNTNDCYNDFFFNVYLSPDDAGKWVYREVLFADLLQDPQWGFQYPEGTPFPQTKSIGLKFQFGYAERFDFYIDDITLLR